MLTVHESTPAIYATEETRVEDKIITTRFFALASGAYWLIAEYDPEDRIAFGYCNLGDDEMAEWGNVSLDELESLKWHGIPRVERDEWFNPMPFREAMKR